MTIFLDSDEPMRTEARPGGAVLSQLASFVGIGGGAALAFVALSQAVVGAVGPVPDWVASALCYAAFILPVYLLHRRFSFRSEAPHAVALPRYAAVQIGGLMLAALFSFIAYGMLGLPELAAALMVIVLASGVNFAILRLWAFAEIRAR